MLVPPTKIALLRINHQFPCFGGCIVSCREQWQCIVLFLGIEKDRQHKLVLCALVKIELRSQFRNCRKRTNIYFTERQKRFLAETRQYLRTRFNSIYSLCSWQYCQTVSSLVEPLHNYAHRLSFCVSMGTIATKKETSKKISHLAMDSIVSFKSRFSLLGIVVYQRPDIYKGVGFIIIYFTVLVYVFITFFFKFFSGVKLEVGLNAALHQSSLCLGKKFN